MVIGLVPVPIYAKERARQALKLRAKLPTSQQFGLDTRQAHVLGINSGVARAKQLISNKTIPDSDARRVAAFYSRFRNCHTPKCEGSLNLWGGRMWGRELYNKYKK